MNQSEHNVPNYTQQCRERNKERHHHQPATAFHSRSSHWLNHLTLTSCHCCLFFSHFSNHVYLLLVCPSILHILFSHTHSQDTTVKATQRKHNHNTSTQQRMSTRNVCRHLWKLGQATHHLKLDACLFNLFSYRCFLPLWVLYALWLCLLRLCFSVHALVWDISATVRKALWRYRFKSLNVGNHLASDEINRLVNSGMSVPGQ